jgi:hypothetical protein
VLNEDALEGEFKVLTLAGLTSFDVADCLAQAADRPLNKICDIVKVLNLTQGVFDFECMFMAASFMCHCEIAISSYVSCVACL